MADPLTLLRKYVTSGRLDDVVVSGDRVEFGSEYSFKRNAKTAFKSKVKDRGFYDLDALLHLAKAMGAADYSRASYVSGTRAANVAAVAFPDTQVQRLGTPASQHAHAARPPVRPPASPHSNPRCRAGSRAVPARQGRHVRADPAAGAAGL